MIEVLLHTVIDWMRTEDEEDEGREINHHGKSITVGTATDTVPLVVDEVLKLLRYFCHLNFFTAAEHESWTKQPDETTIHWKDEQE